jgi:hypothetical protein
VSCAFGPLFDPPKMAQGQVLFLVIFVGRY